MNVLRKAAALLVLSLSCLLTFAQTRITGNVSDPSGESIIGATVKVKGTNTGVITDVDGNFAINAQPSDVLQFTFLGYIPQEVEVGSQTTIKVVLEEDSKELDEVVLVGYGQMKKNDLTGSVASIGTEKIAAKGVPSVLEALQGSAPGVNITQSSSRTGGSFDIEIRGKSSTNSSTKPVYVIDGVICSDMDFLNPQDIERIDVLKDASSTAIYGSRATAGVILVTTKSGVTVSGKSDPKPTVSYDGYYGVSKIARMPELMDGQEFYQYRFLKFLSYAGEATASSGQPDYNMGAYEQMALYNADTKEYRLKSLLASGDTWDWPSLVTQDGRQQNHYVSASGKSGNVNYHLGAGYNQTTGIYVGDEENRFNLKGSVDAKINKVFAAGFSMNLAQMNNSYANDEGVKIAYRMNAFMQPYDENGELNQKPGNFEAMGSSAANQFSDQTNPLLYNDNRTKEKETYRMMGNFYLKATPLKGLDIKTNFSPNFTYYRLGQFDDTIVDNETNSAQLTTQRSFGWTWDNTVNYSKSFGQHSINLMGLFSMESYNAEYAYLTYGEVMDGTLWYNLATGTYVTDSKNSYTENSLMSYAARLNYSYAGRYMITGTVRRDGSSKFADGHRWGTFPSVAAAWRASEEEWLNADWLSNLKLRLSYGLTGNNAGIGNYATQQTVSSPIYYPFGGTYYQGYIPDGIVDKALSWESSKETNFGVDFGFLDNRIVGSVDTYNKLSDGLLYSVRLPLEAAGNSLTTNVGSVSNKGIEISLTTVNIARQNLRWETTFSFAHNDNRVVEINGTGKNLPNDGLFIGQPINNIYGYDWIGIVSDRDMVVPDNDIAVLKGFTPGETVRECDYYYACYGWTEGQVIIDDVNGDGQFTDGWEEDENGVEQNIGDKKIFSCDPDWTGSFSTTLTYKNWDFSANVYAKVGYMVSSPFYSEYLNWSDRGRVKLQVDYYIPAGTLIDCDGLNADGTLKNPVYQEYTHYGSYPFPNNGGLNGGVGSSLYQGAGNTYIDATYVKVKNITLGYTLPKDLVGKAGISNLRLYCTVTNPFVWSPNYKGFDPEWASASLSNQGPSTITYELGASLKF